MEVGKVCEKQAFGKSRMAFFRKSLQHNKLVGEILKNTCIVSIHRICRKVLQVYDHYGGCHSVVAMTIIQPTLGSGWPFRDCVERVALDGKRASCGDNMHQNPLVLRFLTAFCVGRLPNTPLSG